MPEKTESAYISTLISQPPSFLVPSRPTAAFPAHKLFSYLSAPIPRQRVIPQALMRPRNRLLRMIIMSAHARCDGGHQGEEGGRRVHSDETNRFDGWEGKKRVEERRSCRLYQIQLPLSLYRGDRLKSITYQAMGQL